MLSFRVIRFPEYRSFLSVFSSVDDFSGIAGPKRPCEFQENVAFSFYNARLRNHVISRQAKFSASEISSDYKGIKSVSCVGKGMSGIYEGSFLMPDSC